MDEDEDPRPPALVEVMAWEVTGPNVSLMVYTGELAEQWRGHGISVRQVWLFRDHIPGSPGMQWRYYGTPGPVFTVG